MVPIKKSRSRFGVSDCTFFQNLLYYRFTSHFPAIFRALSEKLGSNYDWFIFITLLGETKFSNTDNLKYIYYQVLTVNVKLI